jgi:hypothetical protein
MIDTKKFQDVAFPSMILCNSFGMKLISFETEEKWNTIRDYLIEKSKYTLNE